VSARHALAGASRGVSRGDLLGQTLRGSHTPLYASPEQTWGGEPDPRDDVHALGVLWYQLLVGDLRRGVGADVDDELREMGVSGEAVAVLRRCVARAERRWADAGVLAEKIQGLSAAGTAHILTPAVPAPGPSTPNTERREGVLVVSAAGDGTHRTITEAIRAAVPGMEIRIRPGTYREGVVLDRSVSLVGDGPAGQVVLESDEASCIRMDTNEATVRGLTLRCVAARRNKQLYAVDIPGGYSCLYFAQRRQ
jgi:hypothetical protein